MKGDLFLKIIVRQIREIPYENSTFVQGKLYQKLFLFYTEIILLILRAHFVLTWRTPRPAERRPFLKFEKICNWRNS